MLIRLMGSEDVVRAWARRFEAMGVSGTFYPMRHGRGIRWYADVDDRLAEEIGEDPPAAFRPRPPKESSRR